MYTSRNKQESRALITKLDLNTVPEVFLANNDYVGMKSFIDNNKAKRYVVRDAEHASSKYFYVDDLSACKEAAKQFSGKIILAVSLNSYENKLLLGAVEICEDKIKICATTDSTKDHRTLYDNPEFNYATDIFDKRLSSIPCFDDLYKFVLDNKLEGLTIEFTVYDKLVGNKKQKILINELRNY